MTEAQQNVYEALVDMTRKDRKWLPHSVLEAYNANTVAALVRQGLLEVDLEYGVRVLQQETSV